MNKKEILLGSLPNLLLSLAILAVIILFRLPFWGVAALIASVTIGRYCYSTLIKKDGLFSIRELLKSLLSLSLFLGCLYILYWLTAGWGILGFCFIAFLISIYLLIRRRKFFLYSIRDIEKQIWGKPLDKKDWAPGEFKNKKVKFVWRKKNNETQKKDRLG